MLKSIECTLGVAERRRWDCGLQEFTQDLVPLPSSPIAGLLFAGLGDDNRALESIDDVAEEEVARKVLPSLLDLQRKTGARFV